MTLNNWINSDKVYRITDSSIVADGIKNLGRRYAAMGGEMDLSKTSEFMYFDPVNTSYRVPASMINSNYRTNIFYAHTAGLPVGYNFRIENGFQGYSQGSYATVESNSIILDFIPRMFVRLTKFSDFYKNYLKTNNYTNHYWAKTILADYAFANMYGYKFNGVSADDLSKMDAYVLTTYAIYTNKNDGTEQDLLSDYNYDTYTSGSNMTVYDMFIPCACKGTHSKAVSGEYMYVPYMRSLIAKRMYSAATATSSYTAFMPMYVGFDGVLGSNISGAINMFSVNSTKDFTANPFMTGGSKPFDNWAQLTSAPVGNNVNVISYTVASLATWKKIFNSSGLWWSFDLDDVISPYDTHLNKPSVPGQPKDPTDDDDGDGDNTSDDIEYPEVTNLPGTSGRYFYALNAAKVNSVMDFLFNDTFLNDVRRIWTNPGDYIIDLSYYPIDFISSELHFTPSIDADPDTIYIGNISSGVKGYKIGTWGAGKPLIYGGSVDVRNYYNSYLDYAPYTRISIYIPYIGIRPLDINQIANHTLKLMYYFDLNTGQFVALLGVDGDGHLGNGYDEVSNFRGNIGKPIAQYSGSMAIHIPINGSLNSQYLMDSIIQSTQIVSSAGAIAGGMMSGNVTSTISGITGINNAISNPITKPETYGTLTPSTGIYCPQTAYLIIDRPKTAEPSQYKNQKGYTSCYSSAGGLGAFSGYLKCSSVNIPMTGTMTENEHNAIVNLLLGGIYID